MPIGLKIMDDLILSCRNGRIIFSDEDWCSVTLETPAFKRTYGYENKVTLYRRMLNGISDEFCNDHQFFEYGGKKVMNIFNLSDMHTAVYLTSEGEQRKIIFQVFDPDRNEVCIEVSEKELELWKHSLEMKISSL